MRADAAIPIIESLQALERALATLQQAGMAADPALGAWYEEAPVVVPKQLAAHFAPPATRAPAAPSGGIEARRACLQAYGQLYYRGNDLHSGLDDPGRWAAERFTGVVVLPPQVIGLIEPINTLKDRFKAAVRTFERAHSNMTCSRREQGELIREPLIRTVLREAGYARLHMLQTYRTIKTLTAPVTRILLTSRTSTITDNVPLDLNFDVFHAEQQTILKELAEGGLLVMRRGRYLSHRAQYWLREPPPALPGKRPQVPFFNASLPVAICSTAVDTDFQCQLDLEPRPPFCRSKTIEKEPLFPGLPFHRRLHPAETAPTRTPRRPRLMRIDSE